MRTNRTLGFTLVEILVVVVILGILAAIVVPQFAGATQDTLKTSLSNQIRTLSTQTELYRGQHTNLLPHQDPTDPLVAGAGGLVPSTWGVLVNQEYLKGEPFNGFTASSSVVFDAAATAIGDGVAGMLAVGAAPAPAGASTAWIYASNMGSWSANGFNTRQNLISTEPGFVVPTW